MNRQLIAATVFLAGLGVAGITLAQGRWDERPHGYNAQLAKAKKSAVETPSAVGGRHDEKPHGMTKRVEPKAPVGADRSTKAFSSYPAK